MWSGWFFRLFVLVFFAAAAAPAYAADAMSRTALVMREAFPRAAKSAPDPQEALEAARGRLNSSVGQLRQFLATGGSQKEAGWRRWLDLPSLEAELAAHQPDAAILSKSAQRFSEPQTGFELPTFVAVRRDLRHLLAASEFAADDAPQRLYHDRLSELAMCLGRLEAEFTPEDAHRAGELVAWLASLGGEGANLADTIRAHYCRTNAVAQSSARLINLLMERSVQDRRSIAETVLGAYVQGIALTRANVSFGFMPSQEHATLDIRMRGLTAAPANVAQRGRVSVYTSANTSIRANKHVYLNDEGLRFAPAVAAAATNMQINDIEAGRRIIERMAWRRAGRMAPEAEQATSQRAQAEASTQLDRQATASLSDLNNTFRQKIRAPLIRCNALPAQWNFWTDAAHLRMSLAQCNDTQLAVASPAPQFPASYDVALGAHESMIINLSEAMVGGTTVEDANWLEMVKLLTGDSPRALWVHDRSERWSVTLADERPVVPRFGDDRVGFTLRLAKVTRGSDVFDHPVEITARFKLQSTRDGPALTREGDVLIRFLEFTDPNKQERMQAFLARKFGAVFPPELVFHGITPPEGGTLGKLNRLQLAEFQAADGWLTIGYELEQAP
jgi:hypothetical protein